MSYWLPSRTYQTPALDENCYDSGGLSIETLPLSVELEVEHAPGTTRGDYNFDDFSPEEADGEDDDTTLLGKTIEIGNQIIPDPFISGLISALSYIEWNDLDPIDIDSDLGWGASDDQEYIKWDIVHVQNSEDDFPDENNPTSVGFTIDGNQGGQSIPTVFTHCRYTVRLWTYGGNQCPCEDDGVIPITETITPTTLAMDFQNGE